MVKAMMTALGDSPQQTGPSDPKRTNIITITSKFPDHLSRMFANFTVIRITITTTSIPRNPVALLHLRT